MVKIISYSLKSLNIAILLQPIQIFVNIIFISIFIAFGAEELKNQKSEWYGEESYAMIILTLSVVNILMCFIKPICKIRKAPVNMSQPKTTKTESNWEAAKE